jgi:hypothetical protein
MSKVYKTAFGMTPNSLLNNNKISLKAKGLYGYMHSKPDGWDFSIKGIASQLLEQYKAVASGLKELEQAGYLTRKNYQATDGKWTCDYYLHEIPLKVQPTTLEPTTLEPTPREGGPLDGMTKKEIISKKEQVKKKKSSSSEPTVDEIQLVINRITNSPIYQQTIGILRSKHYSDQDVDNELQISAYQYIVSQTNSHPPTYFKNWCTNAKPQRLPPERYALAQLQAREQQEYQKVMESKGL